MAETTGIEWARSTFNPWWGCEKISPACDNCYAAELGHRFGTEWGHDQPRRFFGDKHWNEPLLWEKKAAAEQAVDPKATWRVFCSSMADVFDNAVPQAVRDRLWALIKATPHLTWLLLTKRVGNVAKMLPADWGNGYPNVWLGSTIANQTEADRDLPKLFAIRARVRFVSIEPMLAYIDMGRHLWVGEEGGLDFAGTLRQMLHWVIVGGESGANARPMHPDWARSMRDQCAAAGVPFLFKQWGEWAPADRETCSLSVSSGYIHPTLPNLPRPPERRPLGIGYGPHELEELGCAYIAKVGKKAAGRLLDGVQHDGYPEVRA